MKYFTCFILGGLYTLSFSPYNISIFSIFSIVLFLLLIDLEEIKSTILKSLFFSLGYFSVGTYWLNNVITYYADVNYFLTILLVIIFTFYLSFFFIVPVAITSLLNKKIKIKKNYSLIVLAILITIFEIFRSNLFTGYSWLNFGQAAINTPLENFFPVFGVHGLTFIIFIISIIFINIFKNKDTVFFVSLATFILIGLSGIYKKNWTTESDDIIKISIIQPNIKNKLSYSNEEIINRMKILKELTLSSSTFSPNIILWPEAPLPIIYNDLKDSFYKEILEDIPKSSSLVTGTFYKDGDFIYNSIINVSAQANNIYNKKHLVPFGEFLPFKNVLRGIYESLGLNIYDIKNGDTRNSLKISNYTAHPLICYESIFSFESLVIDKDTDFILNVSNDGWFGDNSLAPYQHLDALVMRSLENQRYSIRSTNTGISAIITPDGTIADFIKYNERGYINKEIYARNGQTPLSKYGYDIIYFFLFTVFLYSTIYFNFNSFKRS